MKKPQEEISEFFQRGSTLSSFITLFESEMEVHPHIKEAYKFGKSVVKVAGELEGRIDLRGLVHCFVGSALQVSSTVYRAHSLPAKNEEREEKIRIYKEALDELNFCQRVLKRLDSSLNSFFKSLREAEEQAEFLQKVIEQRIENLKFNAKRG